MKQLKYFIFALCAVCGFTACEDMFETESNRQIFDPELNEKTDSMFYTLGIMKGIQQVADQYVLTNEMRGDLVATNSYTETSLRQLASFSVDATNKYDSAYLYYRVINNCNYFIAHRDSTLRTGDRKVSIPEIAQAYSARAWAYLQLVKTYGRVPFYTNPLVTIGDASRVTDSVDLGNIVDKLAPELIQYSKTLVPTYGEISAGYLNSSTSDNPVEKKIHSSNIMLPASLVLGDLYLETHQYEKAAESYATYINLVRLSLSNFHIWPKSSTYREQLTDLLPANMPNDASDSYVSWNNIFRFSSPMDSVSYIPMASNRLRGTTTDLPRYFGCNFYRTSGDPSYLLERQIEASSAYLALSDAQEFYYRPMGTIDTILVAPVGDMRRYATFTNALRNDSSFAVMVKFENANIPLYRGATVYLRLAEALNRCGYPELAFAILKEGINPELYDKVKLGTDDDNKVGQIRYVRPEAFAVLINPLELISTEVNEATGVIKLYSQLNNNYGIHSRGTYATNEGRSPYQYNEIVGKKIAEMQTRDGFVPQGSLSDTIIAVEDLLCDEMALELAFEGTRFGDLTRIARHRNNQNDPVNVYGTNFGGQWLARKLAYKHPAVALDQESNWYLPFR